MSDTSSYRRGDKMSAPTYRFQCINCKISDPEHCMIPSFNAVYVDKKTGDFYCTECASDGELDKKIAKRLKRGYFEISTRGKWELDVSCDACNWSGVDVRKLGEAYLCDNCFEEELPCYEQPTEKFKINFKRL